MSTVHATNGRSAEATVRKEFADAADNEQNALKKIERRARWRGRWRIVKLILILVLIGIFVWIFRDKVLVTVDSGEALVVYYRFFGGTRHDQIGHEGLHIIAPWDKAYKYVIRTQSLVVPMTVLSKNGLEVHLDAQIRFRPYPENLPYMHRRYGPDYVKTIVVPQLIESVQKVIGQFMPEELYSSETGASVGRIFGNAKRLIGGVFLDVEDIALFNIKLPVKVQDAIQTKAVAEQNALAAAFRVQQEQRETERKLIEAKGLQQYANTVSGIPRSVLVWKGIEATLELSKSPNAKVIVMGSRDNLPLMLGNVPDLATEK